jgi:hypothetical protein
MRGLLVVGGFFLWLAKGGCLCRQVDWYKGKDLVLGPRGGVGCLMYRVLPCVGR